MNNTEDMIEQMVQEVKKAAEDCLKLKEIPQDQIDIFLSNQPFGSYCSGKERLIILEGLLKGYRLKEKQMLLKKYNNRKDR